MDRLKCMETFVRVADSGSFTAVAKQERTTQSAISKQVLALEEAVGTRLLVRSTRSQALTEAGRLYYDRCVQILADLEDARLEVQRAENDISGTVRVAAPVAFGRLHIVPRLPGFYAQYPHLKIHLMLDDGFIDLVSAGIDVTFRVGELRDSRLIARRIGTARRSALASPDYMARHGRPVSPQDLHAHNCLVYSGLAVPNEWTFHHPDQTPQTVYVQGNFETNSSEAIRQATLEGLGIAYAPIWIYGNDLRQGRIQAVFDDWQGIPLPVNVVFQPARRPSLKVKAFVDHFTHAFAQDPDIAPLIG